MDFTKIMGVIRFCANQARSYKDISEHFEISERNARRWLQFVDDNCPGVSTIKQFDGRQVKVRIVGQTCLSPSFRHRDLMHLAALDQSANFLELNGRKTDARLLRDTIELLISNLARQQRIEVLGKVQRLAEVEAAAGTKEPSLIDDDTLLTELRLAAMHGRTVELVTHSKRINGSILALSHDQQHGWSVVLTGGTAQLDQVRSIRGVEDLQMGDALAA